METIVVKIRNLTSQQVELVNKYILPEFDVYIVQPLRYPDNSRFVFLIDKGEVVSFARIFETSIEFKTRQYKVLGLSMVYSIEKQKGYGKKLLEEIIKISDQETKLLIGNCEPKNKDFYVKCGLEVLENTIKRFVYINPRNIAEVNQNDSIVLIHDHTNKFIQALQGLQNENVFIFEHWW